PTRASEVFAIFSVELIEIGIGRGEAPAGIEFPVGGEFDPTMFRPRRVELETRIRCVCRSRLGDQFVAEKFVEAGRAELQCTVRRPVETEIVAEVLLRLKLCVIAVLTVSKDKKVSDLRCSIASRDASSELPLGIRPIEQRELWRSVLELPVR